MLYPLASTSSGHFHSCSGHFHSSYFGVMMCKLLETGRGPGTEQVSPVGSANPFEECPGLRRN